MARQLAFSSAGTVSPRQLPATPASPARAQLGVRVPQPQHPATVLKAGDAAAPKPAAGVKEGQKLGATLTWWKFLEE